MAWLAVRELRWRLLREAMFYESIGDSVVRCRLCPRECVIAVGKRGFCGVRENRDGVLYALNYGLVTAFAVDPVEKKPMLLAKFLIARGVFKPVDPWNLDVPVDNHLTRIALRTGLVRVEGLLWEKIKGGREFTSEEDVLLRLVVRRAYRVVARNAGIDPGVIDDVLWIHGRKVCLRDSEPLCSKCVFKSFCLAYQNPEYMVPEHYYYNTWYY